MTTPVLDHPVRRTDAPPVPGRTPGDPTNLDDLARALAEHARDAHHRARMDEGLGLLLGPAGLDAGHLVPGPRTPDVVRRRTAGWVLRRLDPSSPVHRRLVAAALDLVRG